MKPIKPITRDIAEGVALDASLQRLDVVELDKRLEFSPLLVESGLQHGAGDVAPNGICCVCKIPPQDPLPDPIIDAGSTGPTSGVWGR